MSRYKSTKALLNSVRLNYTSKIRFEVQKYRDWLYVSEISDNSDFLAASSLQGR